MAPTTPRPRTSLPPTSLPTGGYFRRGRGYHSGEVDTYGAPSTITDSDANRELFEEQVEIILKSFNSDSFPIKANTTTFPPTCLPGYDLKNLTLVPRPRTLPVECWQP